MITLAEAKTYMTITGTTYDTILSAQIDYVEATIETYIDNKIDQTTISGERLSVPETFDLQFRENFDYSNKKLQARTRYSPVSSYSITYEDTLQVENDDYTMDANSGLITFWKNVSGLPSDLLITYTAGYATCPSDLKLVALEMTKQLFQNSGTVTQGERDIKSKSLGDFSVSYESAKTIEQFSTILNRYRRVDI